MTWHGGNSQVRSRSHAISSIQDAHGPVASANSYLSKSLFFEFLTLYLTSVTPILLRAEHTGRNSNTIWLSPAGGQQWLIQSRPPTSRGLIYRQGAQSCWFQIEAIDQWNNATAINHRIIIHEAPWICLLFLETCGVPSICPITDAVVVAQMRCLIYIRYETMSRPCKSIFLIPGMLSR